MSINVLQNNCIEWDGPNQSECLKWSESFELNSSGMWLRKDEYLLLRNLNLFKVLGLVCMVSIIIHLLLSLILGRYFLNKVRNLQVILVLIYSNSNVSQSFKDFSTNVMFINFNFSFLQSFTFSSKHIWWDDNNDQMANLHFYCQSTVQNYFFVLFSVLVLIIITCIYQYFTKFEVLKDFCESIQLTLIRFKFLNLQIQRNQIYIFKLCWFHLIFQFLFISIASDIINFIFYRDALSIFSIIIILLVAICLWRTNPKIFSFDFIIETDLELDWYSHTCSNKL